MFAGSILCTLAVAFSPSVDSIWRSEIVSQQLTDRAHSRTGQEHKLNKNTQGMQILGNLSLSDLLTADLCKTDNAITWLLKTTPQLLAQSAAEHIYFLLHDRNTSGQLPRDISTDTIAILGAVKPLTFSAPVLVEGELARFTVSVTSIEAESVRLITSKFREGLLVKLRVTCTWNQVLTGSKDPEGRTRQLGQGECIVNRRIRLWSGGEIEFLSPPW